MSDETDRSMEMSNMLRAKSDEIAKLRAELEFYKARYENACTGCDIVVGELRGAREALLKIVDISVGDELHIAREALEISVEDLGKCIQNGKKPSSVYIERREAELGPKIRSRYDARS